MSVSSATGFGKLPKMIILTI